MTDDTSHVHHAVMPNAEVEKILRETPPEHGRTHALRYALETPSGTVSIVEHVSGSAWFRERRRAVWLLPGPIATGAFFTVPVQGFDAATVLAGAGFVCVTVDFLGTGASSRPADGRSATVASQAAVVAAAVRAYCGARGLDGVHLLGESWGGAVACQLAGEPELARSCVMVSTLYRTSTPTVDALARAPQWRGFLDSLPDGYLPVGEEIWASLLVRSPPAVRDWALHNQVGSYAAGPMYAVLDLPYFDPSRARVPGLVIHGAQDDRQSSDDARELATRYARTQAELVVLREAGHIPRIEAGAKDQFWSEVVGFFERVDAGA